MEKKYRNYNATTPLFFFSRYQYSCFLSILNNNDSVAIKYKVLQRCLQKCVIKPRYAWMKKNRNYNAITLFLFLYSISISLFFAHSEQSKLNINSSVDVPQKCIIRPRYAQRKKKITMQKNRNYNTVLLLFSLSIFLFSAHPKQQLQRRK